MLLTLALFFVATFSLVAASVVAYRFVQDRRALLEGAEEADPNTAAWLDSTRLLKEDNLSTITFWNKLLARVDYVAIMKQRLAEAGLKWTVGRLTLLMLLLGALAYGALSSWLGAPWWLAVGGAVGASAAPYLWVLRRRRKRLLAFEAQFPDALDSLSRALRAGQPLAGAMRLVASEAPRPVAEELAATVEELELGSSWEEALEHLAERVPVSEVSIFAASVKLQHRMGGDLTEVLARLSESLREAAALRGEVRAIAAHGRMTGLVLTLLP
ncbi:MAG TPA: hypothetical protein ENK13_00775, partial [Thermopetrobacter sp.]|nr:hypothetical protein [Thermopetrobacter sp.]